MAEIQVTDEQGNVHIFPDGSTPDMISKALNVKAPSQSPSIDLSNNQGQGTYSMWDNAGHKQEVPYGQVPIAAHQGWKFDTNKTKTGLDPQQQFFKDLAADPNHTGGAPMSFTPAAGDPRGDIAYQHQMEANAPLALRVAGGIAKAGGTLARPVLDIAALKTGSTPEDVSDMLTPRSTAEKLAKYGTVGAAIVPAAVAAPAATAGALAGGTLGAMGGQYAAQKMGLTPQQTQVLGDVTGAAGGVAGGMAARPIANLAGRAALLGKTPEAAYESALKPSTTLSQPERAAMVKTGLENEIPISKAGVERIGNLISDLNQKIQATIDADPNRNISTVPALRNLDATRARFANQVTPQPDMAEISNVESNFLNNPKVQPQGAGPGPASLGAADAQAMKQGTYRALGSKAYGEVKGASVEAQKALARGLKEEIANQFPEINTLNAAESRLFDLQPVLERAVNRISNHQLIGIGTPVAGAATEAVTSSPGLGSAAMVLKAVLDNPNVKSRLAIAISKAQKIPPAKASAAVRAYSAALGATAGATQASSSDGTPSQ